MLDFVFEAPTRFVFGKGVENQVGKQLKEYGVKKVLLHYGGKSALKSGLIDRVRTSLNEAGVGFTELPGVVANPRLSMVYTGIEIVKKEGLDGILAVGGGSVIDSSKAIGMGAVYDGDVWDFYTGKAIPVKTLPVFTVLTLPAAGSEGSLSSVITKEDEQLKRACDQNVSRPKISFMDPELTYTLPPFQTACGITDMMAHVMERYFSNTPDTCIEDRLAEGIMKTLVEIGPKVLEDPLNYNYRAEIMWAGMLAHNNIVGNGREQDWASHLIEHELSGIYDIAHGAGLAVIFPAWAKYVYKHDVKRFAMYARNVFNVEEEDDEKAAVKGIEAMENFFASLGLKTRLRDLGIDDSHFEEMARKTPVNPHGYTGNFVRLSPEDIVNIYKLAL